MNLRPARWTAASLLLAAASPFSTQAELTINPTAGYSITWNGNEGDHFGQAVPDNLALAANGAEPISSGELGPELLLSYHLTSNINDGLYGNNASWIGGEEDSAPWYAGVMFEGPVLISSIAFGRDNGDAGIESYQYTDRSEGIYDIQFTEDGVNWSSIGTLTYTLAGNDGVPGEAFTSYLRHEYNVSTIESEEIRATGLRIGVAQTGAFGNAIDELEVYGSVVSVPEPTAASIFMLALGTWLVRRRLNQA